MFLSPATLGAWGLKFEFRLPCTLYRIQCGRVFSYYLCVYTKFSYRIDEAFVHGAIAKRIELSAAAGGGNNDETCKKGRRLRRTFPPEAPVLGRAGSRVCAGAATSIHQVAAPSGVTLGCNKLGTIGMRSKAISGHSTARVCVSRQSGTDSLSSRQASKTAARIDEASTLRSCKSYFPASSVCA